MTSQARTHEALANRGHDCCDKSRLTRRHHSMARGDNGTEDLMDDDVDDGGAVDGGADGDMTDVETDSGSSSGAGGHRRRVVAGPRLVAPARAARRARPAAGRRKPRRADHGRLRAVERANPRGTRKSAAGSRKSASRGSRPAAAKKSGGGARKSAAGARGAGSDGRAQGGRWLTQGCGCSRSSSGGLAKVDRRRGQEHSEVGGPSRPTPAPAKPRARARARSADRSG